MEQLLKRAITRRDLLEKMDAREAAKAVTAQAVTAQGVAAQGVTAGAAPTSTEAK